MIALLTRTALFALGIVLGASAYAQTNPPKPAASAAKETLNQEDQRFVKEAGAGGLAEVELSKIAQNSENPDVKSFADRMVQDHTTANQELVPIATGLGTDVPKALDAEHQRMAQRLAGLHGKGVRRAVHARHGRGSQQGRDAVPDRGALRPEHGAQTICAKDAAYTPDTPENGAGIVA
jgi:predicted outer membrane protein